MDANYELINLAEKVYEMRAAQKEFQRLKYSPDFEKRGEVGEMMRHLQKRVDAEIEDILNSY
jgi:hypothetical protein